MSCLSIWTDESQVDLGGKTYWLIGQLIIRPEVEYAFLSSLRASRKTCKTWDALHACELKSGRGRLWELAHAWVDSFLEFDGVYFHVFAFKESTKWKSTAETPNHYIAGQLFFGLGNKMRGDGIKIQTLFRGVDTIIACLDRKSKTTGYTVETKYGAGAARDNHLEDVFEKQIHASLSRQARLSKLTLRLSFVNSRCFDAMQFCDLLTHAVRDQFLFEKNADHNRAFLELMQKRVFSFSPTGARALRDLNYTEKVNYFISEKE